MRFQLRGGKTKQPPKYFMCMQYCAVIPVSVLKRSYVSSFTIVNIDQVSNYLLGLFMGSIISSGSVVMAEAAAVYM